MLNQATLNYTGYVELDHIELDRIKFDRIRIHHNVYVIP